MKRVLAGLVLAAAGIGLAAQAIDHFVLHPQRQAVKILRYYASSDARRIRDLEQKLGSQEFEQAGEDARAVAERCIRQTVPLIKADYDAVPAQFQRCKSPISSYVNRWLPSASENQLFAVYVTAVTSQLGSYGPSSETDARQIAKDDVLNCTQTMIFVAATIKTFIPSASVREVAMENSSLGMHGLVEVRINGTELTLDGSTGTVFLASMGKMFRPASKHVSLIEFFEETDSRLADMLEELVRSVQLGRLSEANVVSSRPL